MSTTTRGSSADSTRCDRDPCPGGSRAPCRTAPPSRATPRPPRRARQPPRPPSVVVGEQGQRPDDLATQERGERLGGGAGQTREPVEPGSTGDVHAHRPARRGGGHGPRHLRGDTVLVGQLVTAWRTLSSTAPSVTSPPCRWTTRMPASTACGTTWSSSQRSPRTMRTSGSRRGGTRRRPRTGRGRAARRLRHPALRRPARRAPRRARAARPPGAPPRGTGAPRHAGHHGEAQVGRIRERGGMVRGGRGRPGRPRRPPPSRRRRCRQAGSRGRLRCPGAPVSRPRLPRTPCVRRGPATAGHALGPQQHEVLAREDPAGPEVAGRVPGCAARGGRSPPPPGPVACAVAEGARQGTARRDVGRQRVGLQGRPRGRGRTSCGRWSRASRAPTRPAPRPRGRWSARSCGRTTRPAGRAPGPGRGWPAGCTARAAPGTPRHSGTAPFPAPERTPRPPPRPRRPTPCPWRRAAAPRGRRAPAGTGGW